jgi:hypothetical protein
MIRSFSSNLNLYISVHIPKTAGTFFRTLLEELSFDILFLNYEEDNPNTKILVGGELFTPPIDQSHIDYFFELCHTHSGIALMHGHFGSERFNHLMDNANFISWVREPIQRLFSLYFYWRRWKPKLPNELYQYFNNKNMSFDEFATDTKFINYQHRYLRGVSISNYSFIGVVEHLHESLQSLSDHFPDLLHLDWDRFINANPSRTTDLYQTKCNKEKIRSMNHLDYQIYDEVMLKRSLQ